MKKISFSCALAIGLALLGGPSARAFTWSSSGFGGGGTQNSLAIDPNNSNIIVVASDVSGWQRSTDGGKTWVGSNQGTTDDSGPQEVGAVTWNNDTSSGTAKATVYAECSSGFYISTDSGVSWTLTSNAIQCEANGTSLRWPRDTGNLIAVDQSGSGKYIYAAVYQTGGGSSNGLYRSTDGGQNWTNLGLSSYEITGVTFDPNHSAHVYVTTRGNGVYWTSTAHGSGPGWNQLGVTSGSNPLFAEEAVVVGSTLYVVGATTDDSGNYDKGGGLWTSDVSSGTPTSMTQQGGSSLPSTTSWTAVAVSGSDVYVGAAYDPGSHVGTIWRSTNGGSSFSSITASANINTTIYDGGGDQWWLGSNSAYKLGGNAAGISQLEIDPNNSSKLVGAIRATVWGSQNVTAGAGSVAWYPYAGGYAGTGGIGVTGCTGLAVDPNHAGYVYVGLSDWTFVYSTDTGKTWHSNTSGMPTGDRCDSIWVDPNDGTVYLGQTSYQANFGTVDSTSNVSGTWNDIGPDVSSKLHGVCSGKDGKGDKVVVALAENGIWRTSDGGSSWKQNTAFQATGGYTREDFTWAAGSKYVYCYEQDSGLWRSSDYGVSWTEIWNQSTGNTNYTGYLAALPSNPDNTLFVSIDSGVYKIANASTVTSSTVNPVNLNCPIASPGPMALGTNGGYALYVASAGGSSGTPSFYECATPATTPTWSNIGDSVTIPGQGAWGSSVRQDPNNGQIYLDLNHEGVLMGSP
jgi:hypothetical protein